MLTKLSNNLTGFPYTKDSADAITYSSSAVVRTAKLFKTIVLLQLRLVQNVAYSVAQASGLMRRDLKSKNSVMDKFFSLANSAKDFAKENQTIIKTASIGLAVTAIGYYTYPKVSEWLGSNIIDEIIDNKTSQVPLKLKPVLYLIDAIKNSPSSADFATCAVPLKPNPISGLISAIKNSTDVAVCTEISPFSTPAINLINAIKNSSVSEASGKAARTASNASWLAGVIIPGLVASVFGGSIVTLASSYFKVPSKPQVGREVVESDASALSRSPTKFKKRSKRHVTDQQVAGRFETSRFMEAVRSQQAQMRPELGRSTAPGLPLYNPFEVLSEGRPRKLTKIDKASRRALREQQKHDNDHYIGKLSVRAEKYKQIKAKKEASSIRTSTAEVHVPKNPETEAGIPYRTTLIDKNRQAMSDREVRQDLLFSVVARTPEAGGKKLTTAEIIAARAALIRANRERQQAISTENSDREDLESSGVLTPEQATTQLSEWLGNLRNRSRGNKTVVSTESKLASGSDEETRQEKPVAPASHSGASDPTIALGSHHNQAARARRDMLPIYDVLGSQ